MEIEGCGNLRGGTRGRVGVEKEEAGWFGLKEASNREKKDNTRIKIYEVKAKPMKH